MDFMRFILGYKMGLKDPTAKDPSPRTLLLHFADMNRNPSLVRLNRNCIQGNAKYIKRLHQLPAKQGSKDQTNVGSRMFGKICCYITSILKQWWCAKRKMPL